MDNIKHQFPTLANKPDLAYFDSAASTQTHESVLNAMDEYYRHNRCNIHRGDYEISRKVSDQVEVARECVADLINAKPEQIIFTAGATEGMNMIAGVRGTGSPSGYKTGIQVSQSLWQELTSGLAGSNFWITSLLALSTLSPRVWIISYL